MMGTSYSLREFQKKFFLFFRKRKPKAHLCILRTHNNYYSNIPLTQICFSHRQSVCHEGQTDLLCSKHIFTRRLFSFPELKKFIKKIYKKIFMYSFKVYL